MAEEPGSKKMSTPVTLVGERVRLEPLTRRHRREIEQSCGEVETWRYMRYARLDSPAAIDRWYEKIENERQKGLSLTLAVIDLPSGSLAGSTSIYEFSQQHRSLEIGRTWYCQRFQHTYVNTECKYLLLSYAFESLGCYRVQLMTDARNERSRRAIERIGARLEGVLRKYRTNPDGVTHDSTMYSIVDDEWFVVKAHLCRLMADHYRG